MKPWAKTEKRSKLFKAVQQICFSMYRCAILSGEMPKASGPCVDCGIEYKPQYDHRSYNDPYLVEVVCHSCNACRGAAKLVVIDPETLNPIEITSRKKPESYSYKFNKRFFRRYGVPAIATHA